jgi:protocatechuate 3,4-dioxygenase alpha subunit
MTPHPVPVPTPGQTIGPFFGFALPYPGGEELVPRNHPDAVRLTGLVLDGAANPVPDAVLEIWQADGHGRIVAEPGSLRRDGYTFTGWGRAATDNTGRYSFTTVRPGATAPGKLPFFSLVVFARGLTNRLFSRIYLPADAETLATDPVLAGLPEDRRRTLLATEDGSELRFDIRLQGVDETVFLTFPGQTA